MILFISKKQKLVLSWCFIASLFLHSFKNWDLTNQVYSYSWYMLSNTGNKKKRTQKISEYFAILRTKVLSRWAKKNNRANSSNSNDDDDSNNNNNIMKEERRNKQTERESVGKSEWNTTRHRQIKPVMGRWKEKDSKCLYVYVIFLLFLT